MGNILFTKRKQFPREREQDPRSKRLVWLSAGAQTYQNIFSHYRCLEIFKVPSIDGIPCLPTDDNMPYIGDRDTKRLSSPEHILI